MRGVVLQQYLSFLLLFIFVSCAGKDATESAVFQADYYLTSGKCAKAQEVLDDAGWSKDANYIGAYSNVYACYAGFSELSAIFGGNLDILETSTPEDIFKSIASFPTSYESVPDSDVYTNMNKGIKTIIEVVGSVPSAALLNSKYGRRKGTDLNSQALYMIIFQFGKFLRLYGNTDSNGTKGTGPHGNECFLDYPNLGTTCNGLASDEGSPYLDFVAEPEEATRRACEGIIYFNNLLDILRNIDLGNSDISAQLQDIVDNIDAYLAGIGSDPDLDDFIGLTSQSACENEVAVNMLGLEKFFAVIFEVLLQ